MNSIQIRPGGAESSELLEEKVRVLTELFERMAAGEEEISFGSLTQGMWDIKTQVGHNLTTIELLGDTFYHIKMHGTRKCAIYKWKGDHLYKVGE